MKTVKASEFKAKCLHIMDEVSQTGEPVTITKRGMPVAELVPARRRPKKLFGAMKSSIVRMGDVISPTGVEWEAERVTEAVLLDTNALIWGVAGDPRLGLKSRSLVEKALRSDMLMVSAISYWEIALLVKRGRLSLAYSTGQWRRNVTQLGIRDLAISGDIGILAVEVEGLHGDPADRMITATAAVQGATLLTADERILGWAGDVSRFDARR